MTIRSRSRASSSDLERAAEDVVVRDRDRAEPLGLGVVDELGRVDGAVERPRRVHVEVGDDPRPVGERVGRRAAGGRAAALHQPAVEVVELSRDVLERAACRFGPGGLLISRTKVRVLGQARCGCRCELGLLLDADGRRDRATRRLRLEQHAGAAFDPGDEDRRLGEERRARRAVACGSDRHAAGQVARDRGPRDQRRRAQEHGLPVGKLAQRVQDAAGAGALVRP